MLQAAPHLLGFVLPVALLVGVRLGGAWTFIPVALLFIAMPIFDTMGGLNLANSSEHDDLSANPWFRAVTWLWIVVQLALLGWGLRIVSARTLTPLEAVGVTLSTGLITGAIGITFAHELVHRSEAFERALGEILLASTAYTHFAIEHVYGHHRHVGTPRDPATARYGESLYRFVPRSVGGGAASACRIEIDRLRKRGRGPLHPSNRIARYVATQAVLYGAVALAVGSAGVAFLACQSAVAIALVETINYVEHYGLQRREIAPGRYERVMPWHSWNSSHRLSNWMLINLARHADHHMLASKRHQVLDHLDAAPQLPAGYGTMFLLALVPPLWRRAMDPRIERWREQYGAHHAATNV